MLVTEVESEASIGSKLGKQGWLAFHAVAFMIGAWNLFAIDLARTPGRWWFWMPVAAWAAALTTHACWLLWERRRGPAAHVRNAPGVKQEEAVL